VHAYAVTAVATSIGHGAHHTALPYTEHVYTTLILPPSYGTVKWVSVVGLNNLLLKPQGCR